MVISPAIYDTPEWKGLSTSARYIYLYLRTRADSVTGKTFPSLQTLVNDLKMSKNTIIEYMPEIEKSGLMVKEKIPGRWCVYTILPVPKEVVPKETGTTPYIGTTPVPNQGHIQIKNISITDNMVIVEKIYQEYPKKVARGQAIKAIKTALKKVGSETLLEAVKKYAVSVRGKDQKFIPHPATWFNGERWLDETPAEAPAEKKSKVGGLCV